MINHVVMFKLKEFGSEQEKKDVLNTIKSGLLGLKDKIDELKYIEVGLNFEVEAKSFDVCLISHFESIAAMDAYQVHPEHQKVAGFIRANIVSRAAVDFEF